ncbi:hypothetical protein L1987_02198 [Smallanthus sonchifolius]|uniref:Uncharacterized protein n=1 Tax=Smallanthus sonchifolius TaxID=185202 RepID=A0ACB9K7C1_9ASTR|nr:hypothetical protein L1987_02198 [Smallanthus sonchifolius]
MYLHINAQFCSFGGSRSYSFTFWHQCIYWTKFVSTYQENATHKFVGSSIPNARSYVEAISSAKNSEEAPWLGRKTQREHPDTTCLMLSLF